MPQAFDEIKYHQLQSLRSFDASESVAQNQFISNLLYNCRSLISVNLKSCTNLSDKAFTSLPIHSPIEEIDLSVDYELTDATLEALAQVGGTLKTLKIRGPNKITNQGNKQTSWSKCFRIVKLRLLVVYYTVSYTHLTLPTKRIV